MHYFGLWSDPEAALKKYLADKDAFHAGRRPRTDTEGTTLKDLCNTFLAHKKTLVDSGELRTRTWQDYKDACDVLVRHFDKGRLIDDLDPEDFGELRKKLAHQ